VIDVYVEAGSRRCLAMAYDWPGWGRQAKTPEEAVARLDDYRARYRRIAERAGVELGEESLDSVEVIEGNATTDFGAPGTVHPRDHRAPITVTHHLALWRAGWESFDECAERAPEALAKGPRGGGRSRSAIVDHVFETERAYAPKIGVRPGTLNSLELRDALVSRAEELILSPAEVKWPLAFLIRRSAWHAVDHLWEIEDRSR